MRLEEGARMASEPGCGRDEEEEIAEDIDSF